MSEEKRYQIAVSLVPGVGDVIGKKLIAYCGSAEAVFGEGVKALNKIPGIGSKLAKIIKESDIIFIKKNIYFIKTIYFCRKFSKLKPY